MRRAAAGALLLLALAGRGLAAEPPVLRVGMETRQPPWTFVPGQDLSREDFRKTPVLTPAQEKQLVGIDMDVLRALERRMGVSIRIVPSSWWDLEKGLAEKQFDLILSSWTPTARTSPALAASAPYWDWGLILAVRAEEARIGSFKDLGGRKVGFYRDPATERSLLAMSSGVGLMPSDDPNVLFEQLRAGALDAVLFDSPFVRWKVAADKAFKVVGEPLNHLGYHVGVRREDADLLKRVDAALAAMTTAGELAELRKKWESAQAPH